MHIPTYKILHHLSQVRGNNNVAFCVIYVGFVRSTTIYCVICLYIVRNVSLIIDLGLLSSRILDEHNTVHVY